MTRDAGAGTVLRLLHVEDVDQVYEIEKQSFLEPWGRERFVKMCPREELGRCIILEKAGQVIGYFVSNVETGRFHLLSLAIHPAHRRQGHATRCLECVQRLATYGAMKTCPDHPGAAHLREEPEGEIYLEVSERNLAAQCLYRKMGYRATRILRNHYPGRDEDAYVMTRKITRADVAAVLKAREGAVGS
jgi:ribosomal-protein-alanine N-acetyltransferase